MNLVYKTENYYVYFVGDKDEPNGDYSYYEVVNKEGLKKRVRATIEQMKQVVSVYEAFIGYSK